QLHAAGLTLIDSRDGTRWHRISRGWGTGAGGEMREMRKQGKNSSSLYHLPYALFPIPTPYSLLPTPHSPKLCGLL
ncbi:MAG: hypothetical protein ACYT04_84405, partial [Nostoc sp.]